MALAVVRLADLRKKRQLIQQTIADELGELQARISEIERGTDLQLTTIERYVKALGGRFEVYAVFHNGAFDLAGRGSAVARGSRARKAADPGS